VRESLVRACRYGFGYGYGLDQSASEENLDDFLDDGQEGGVVHAHPRHPPNLREQE
jgi:hypothetical protein